MTAIMSRKNMALSGQGSIEWILIVAIIAVAIIAGLTLLQDQMNSILADITSALENKGNPTP